MKSWFVFFQSLIVLLLIGFSGMSYAAQTTYQFEDPEKQRVFQELIAELRCPMCQNQNIADSNAMIALDLKRKVYQLVDEGKSKQEVIDYMKSRYGEFVHYQPPITPVTIWLWLLPILFVLVAAGFLVYTRLQANKEVIVTGNNVEQKTEDASSADVAKADELLDKYK